mgnify:CR=1 FL=1
MTTGHNGLTYADAGVDIDAGNALVDRIKPAAKRTNRTGTMGGLGGFGALFDLKAAGTADGKVGIVGHNAHAECHRALCNELADTTEANNTEGLVGEFNARPTTAFPTTSNKRSMGLNLRSDEGKALFRRLVAQADVVLAVGTRLQDFTTGSHSLFAKARIVGLNVNSLDATKWGSLALVADARVGLSQLSEALQVAEKP